MSLRENITEIFGKEIMQKLSSIWPAIESLDAIANENIEPFANALLKIAKDVCSKKAFRKKGPTGDFACSMCAQNLTAFSRENGIDIMLVSFCPGCRNPLFDEAQQYCFACSHKVIKGTDFCVNCSAKYDEHEDFKLIVINLRKKGRTPQEALQDAFRVDIVSPSSITKGIINDSENIRSLNQVVNEGMQLNSVDNAIRSQPYSSSVSPKDSYLNVLIEDCKAIEKQLGYTTNEVDKLRLKRQLNAKEEEISKLENKQSSSQSSEYLDWLTGIQCGLVIKAILDAFDVNSFKQMLSFSLNKELEHITSLSKSFSDVVFDVVVTANKQGWIRDLIHAAINAVPNNTTLNKTLQTLKK